MASRYRNLFLFVGLAAVAVMLLTFDMPWTEVLAHVRRAGVWLPAVILLWIPIYMMNAHAWRLIICDAHTAPSPIGFWRVLKLTISGYALNGITPVGLLGGEPYRIMELTPYMGRARAASSVILYAMMHIFSHFCFWLFSIGVFLLRYGNRLSWPLSVMLVVATLFCLAGVYFFLQGYRYGLAMRTLRIFSHLPLVGHYVSDLADRHAEGIQRVDEQIAALHRQRPSTFYQSLLLEFLARLLGCFELQFILFIFTSQVSYWDCLLMQAFVSLFANLLFFIPMQMGTREGGLAIFTEAMHLNGGYGVLTGLLTRLREIFWTSIGLLLIRIGNKT
ncbi:MAG: flippase-like domain-containing protein [Bacteroidaceae bacterium]|nr:flippase-like domain-containing protein [Bacteroidaceae bacterium]MBR1788305.1 flippase-like domain-containing protein [Bacteroidaceae bacterium]